jgi:hypothetical protein
MEGGVLLKNCLLYVSTTAAAATAAATARVGGTVKIFWNNNKSKFHSRRN